MATIATRVQDWESVPCCLLCGSAQIRAADGLPRAFTSREIHLSHFTAPVLRRSLEQAGLSVIDDSLDPYYSASGIRLVLHSVYYAFHRLLFGLFEVNGYDTIWMVARKVPRQAN